MVAPKNTPIDISLMKENPTNTLESKSFLEAYGNTLGIALGSNFKNNHDHYRFGPQQKKARGWKATLRGFLRDAGYLDAADVRREVLTGLWNIAPNTEPLAWLFKHLGDEESRQTLLDVLAYRSLGPERVMLPLNTREYWADLKRWESQISAGTEAIDLGFMGWSVYKMDLASSGFPITLFTRPPGIQAQFQLQQYRCVIPEGGIEAAEGETVIDAGGCFGDTALYFAHKAGKHGKVFSFEFLPSNLEIFHKNLELNPELASRITIVENPVWSSSGDELFMEGTGPGTRITTKPSHPDASRVETLSIDDMVSSRALERVDFIKMDIEGAELPALKGAEATLRKFRPKLAIAVYHSLEDFWTIPQYLDQLGLGYKFALRHFTIHQEETILFAY